MPARQGPGPGDGAGPRGKDEQTLCPGVDGLFHGNSFGEKDAHCSEEFTLAGDEEGGG